MVDRERATGGSHDYSRQDTPLGPDQEEDHDRRVLVTGGAGFIGSHYVRTRLGGHLDTGDAEVVVLNLLTYAASLTNLDAVRESPRLRFSQGDIRDAGVVARVMTGVDVAVHLAAESHVDRSIASVSDFVSTKVGGTQVLLQAAVEANGTRFVHVSTDEVYGFIDEGSSSEDHPLEPNSPLLGVQGIVGPVGALLPPHVWPARMRHSLLQQLWAAPVPGEDCPPVRDKPAPWAEGAAVWCGGNRRDWLHVDDHCRAVHLVAEAGRPYEVYNIGGGVELSDYELTSLLLDAVGASQDMIGFVPDRKGHDRRYSVDWRKISDELGYAPRVSFAEGVAETVNWYAANREWCESLRRRTG